MTNRTPVINTDGVHTPLSAPDTLSGEHIQLSTDADSTLTLGSDSGLLSTPKGAWSARLRPRQSGTYNAGLLDGNSGLYTAGFIHAYVLTETSVEFTVDLSMLPQVSADENFNTLLAKYKVRFIVAWGRTGQVAFRFSNEVYLPDGSVGTFYSCTDTSAKAALGSSFFELKPVYDLARPILILTR